MSGLLQVNKLADTETAVREDEIGEVYRAVAAGLKAKEPKATAKATADGKMVAAEESTEVDGNVAEGKDEPDAAAAATKAKGRGRGRGRGAATMGIRGRLGSTGCGS